MDALPVVEVNQVYFRYKRGGFTHQGPAILEDVSLSVQKGDFLGVVGPNGAGKTTLVKIILGLLKPDRGVVRVLSRSPEEASSLVGYVPQHTHFDRHFPICVEDLVRMGRLHKAPRIGGYSPADRQAAREALHAVNLEDFRTQPLSALSGGQYQRALIARALANQPEILIMDEPTASVDTHAQQALYDLLQRINRGDLPPHAPVTIILVSHDLGFISSYVNRVACLNVRLVCHPTEQITGTIIKDLYRGPVHIVKHNHIVE